MVAYIFENEKHLLPHYQMEIFRKYQVIWYNRNSMITCRCSESAANNRLKYFQDTYGDYIDPEEFVNGKTAAFRDILSQTNLPAWTIEMPEINNPQK
jgi:hypothetical protein